jgi:hypothetical protein
MEKTSGTEKVEYALVALLGVAVGIIGILGCCEKSAGDAE